jgi:hypothetical protein
VICLLQALVTGSADGKDVSVIGGGNDGNASVPTIDPRLPSGPFPRDPSDYQTPTVIINPQPDGDGSDQFGDIEENGTSTPTVVFMMTSEVSGKSSADSGRGIALSEYRNIWDSQDFWAKERSNAFEGNISESSRMIFARDNTLDATESLNSIALLSENEVSFLGESYNNNAYYVNKEDRIANSISTGAITKRTAYRAWFNDHAYDDLETNEGYTRKGTTYLLDTRNVGINKFSVTSRSENSSSEIDQQYIGEVVMSINFNSSRAATYNRTVDHWLPCCNSGWSNPA